MLTSLSILKFRSEIRDPRSKILNSFFCYFIIIIIILEFVFTSSQLVPWLCKRSFGVVVETNDR